MRRACETASPRSLPKHVSSITTEGTNRNCSHSLPLIATPHCACMECTARRVMYCARRLIDMSLLQYSRQTVSRTIMRYVLHDAATCICRDKVATRSLSPSPRDRLPESHTSRGGPQWWRSNVQTLVTGDPGDAVMSGCCCCCSSFVFCSSTSFTPLLTGRLFTAR